MPDDTFYEEVWNGARAVETLSQHAPSRELLQAAEQLSARLYAGVRGPAVAYIATRGESAVTAYEAEAMDNFVAAAKQLAPEYGQPAFQCLVDLETCRAAGTSAFMCGLALAVCLAERLTPRKEEHVTQEKVIQIGDQVQISAPVVIADRIENSFITLVESTVDDHLKSLLDELLRAVTEVNRRVPDDQVEDAEAMARDAETLVNEATSSKPRRRWYTVSLEGLKQAAINIGELADPVLAIVTKLWPLLLA